MRKILKKKKRKLPTAPCRFTARGTTALPVITGLELPSFNTCYITYTNIVSVLLLRYILARGTMVPCGTSFAGRVCNATQLFSVIRSHRISNGNSMLPCRGCFASGSTDGEGWRRANRDISANGVAADGNQTASRFAWRHWNRRCDDKAAAAPCLPLPFGARSSRADLWQYRTLPYNA